VGRKEAIRPARLGGDASPYPAARALWDLQRVWRSGQ